MLRLHYHPRSTFSQRVRIALAEKGQRAELVEVNMAEREKSGYLELNPYGRIPTLEHDGKILYESTAILEYLEALFPSPALVPNDAFERARMSMHMKLLDLEVGVHTRALIFPSRFVEEDKWDTVTMERCREQVRAHFAQVAKALEGRTYLVDEAFSLAEVCYAPFVRFFAEFRISPPPAVKAWAERILARPSVQANWLDR